ncbi:MAG: UDP-N-acetylmuramoyl-L-alanyl-D-glutamate--2,6-diaminopimelate ligase, partial [Akkermansia sp.]
EVSSHALDQERVAGINFNVGIFTNLTQDHLDYHHTMENYFQAKVKLFEQMAADTKSRRKPVAVINIDDAYGRRLAEMFSGRMAVKTYGSALGADFRMLVHHATARGSEYELEYKGKSYLVRVPLIGKFNMYNSLAALAAVICAGIPVRDAIASLQNIPQVPGRLELFTHPGGAQIFIDYAHTPDALENVCKTLKELCSRRLITVFGCGGNRDKGKRPLMGAVAARLSDACIVTSDNPRSEEPLSIINQITAGMPEGRYAIIPDRARAIATAIDQARLGDIVLIAGKGHENYQELSTGRIDFSDAKEVRRNMRIKDEFTQA